MRDSNSIPHMKKILAVASKNSVKIRASVDAYMKVFGLGGEMGDILEIRTSVAPSGVGNQPRSEDEAMNGAENRLQFIRKEFPDADYWIAIEGGIVDSSEGMYEIGFVCVADAEKKFFTQTPRFFLPEKVAELIRKGSSAGKATDAVFGTEKRNHEDGTSGAITGGLVNRYDLCFLPLVIALSQLKTMGK